MRINISEIQLRQKSSAHLSCNIPRSDALHPHPLRVLVVQTHILLSVALCCRAAVQLVSVNSCSAVYQLLQTEQTVQTFM